MLDHSEQERALQLLTFLLPACNSDTLHRLLCLLSTVAAHAEDSLDSTGREVGGNVQSTTRRSLKKGAKISRFSPKPSQTHEEQGRVERTNESGGEKKSSSPNLLSVNAAAVRHDGH